LDEVVFMDDMMIREKVEKLAEVLCCAQSSGLETLGQLRSWFLDVKKWRALRSHPDILVLSQAASRVLEKMIQDQFQAPPRYAKPECPDPGSLEEIRNLLLDELVDLAGPEPSCKWASTCAVAAEDATCDACGV
jgi:hypothetical protein